LPSFVAIITVPLGDQRVRAGDAHAGVEEDIANDVAGRVDLLGHVLSGDVAAEFLRKNIADFLPRKVNRRHHHVAGPLTAQLHDPLTQVSFHHVDPVFGEVSIEFDLFGHHRLRLGDQLHAMPRGDPVDDRGCFFGVSGEVNDGASRLRLRHELVEVVIEVVDRLGFGRLEHAPQVLEVDLGHHVATVAPPTLLKFVSEVASCEFSIARS
jgi:hypothetical protein